MDDYEYLLVMFGIVLLLALFLIGVYSAFSPDAADTARCCCQCVCQ